MISDTILPSEQYDLKKWSEALDGILDRLEDAEMGLSNQGAGRKDSGSYYTPSDVAAHFWQLFWRHFGVKTGAEATAVLMENDFIEPSIGSGVFLFSMFRSLANIGIGPIDVSKIRFHAVDVNKMALKYVEKELCYLERKFLIKFNDIKLENADFLKWIVNREIKSAIFVGNPPFVTNARGSAWKNLYADFVEAMLSIGPKTNISLILPVSVCFSRDYSGLRRIIKDSGLPISASSYDNIPDCLFKSGKPESGNTNKANSQRCTILNIGGSRQGVVESSALLRWSTGERESFLKNIPIFHDCSNYDLERQIPRPSDEQLTQYLREAEGGRSIREFVSRIGRTAFAVGGVARNFIGIRDYEAQATGIVPMKTNEHDTSLILLQVLTSGHFYKYWRSFGDGFHVTSDLIDRFPISKGLLKACEENLEEANLVWIKRENFAKTKLNSGKLVKSYDFTTAFMAAA